MTDLTKPVSRRTNSAADWRGRRLVVILKPTADGDLIGSREEGQHESSVVYAPLSWVYAALLRRKAGV